jgi:hypothetical protein
MRTATSGRQTDRFIGTLSELSRDTAKSQFRKTNSLPRLTRPFRDARRSSIARLARQAQTDNGQARSRDPANLLAEFLELRVAPVRLNGSPVAGLDWRQKIKHRCSETKTFYVSTRSQKCLVRRRGAWRPCRTLLPVRVDRLAHACANGIEHFGVAVKWQGSDGMSVYIWDPFGEGSSRKMCRSAWLIRMG